ncbi:MAG TPA: GerAB/ArcD/ProY family transporter [Symbiobacteriaceae bacterium]|nr:GerAB/ArcD/ProY family transporter [Symbiobacteriaceae bacterium]
MNDRERIDADSLAVATLTVMLTQSFHAVLLGSLWVGETAAWIAMLISGLGALLFYWPVARQIAARRGGNLLDVAADAAGAPGEILTGVLFGAFSLHHCGLILRQTAEMAVSTVYPHTPQTFAMGTVAVCSVYCAYGGLPAAVRAARLFLPVFAFSLLLILVGALGWADFDYLFPVWGPGIPRVLAGTPLLMVWLWPMLATFYLAPDQVREPRSLPKQAAIAILVTTLAYALQKVELLMVIPWPQGRSNLFPLHQLTRLVTGGRFFERIESVWVFLWTFGTAMHVGLLLHLSARAFAQSFRMPSFRPALVPLSVLLLTVALFPHDVAESITMDMSKAPAGLAIIFIWPLLLAGVAAWRRRRRASGEA